jgi:hypothetical protein
VCRSIVATATGAESMVVWKQPTRPYCEGRLVTVAKCGCALSVWISFLDLSRSDSAKLGVKTRNSSFWCAEHASRKHSTRRPLTHVSSQSIDADLTAWIISLDSAGPAGIDSLRGTD